MIEPRFDYVTGWWNGMRWCEKWRGGVYDQENVMVGHFVNAEGRVLNEFPLGNTGDFMQRDPEFNNGAAIVRIAPDRFAYLNRDGTLGSETRMLGWPSMSDDIRFALVGGKWALETPDGKRLGDALYDEVSPHMSSRVIAVASAGKWGFVDRRGAVVMDHLFEKVLPLYYRYEVAFWGVRQHGRFGLLDRSGVPVLACEYDDVGPEPLPKGVAVRKDERWGVYSIDQRRIVIPAVYEEVGPCSGETVWVMEGAKWGLVDFSGKVLCKPVYSSVRAPAVYERGRLWIVGRDGGQGLVNLDGDEVLAPDRENADFHFLTDDLVRVRGSQVGIFSVRQSRYTVPREFREVRSVCASGKAVGARIGKQWNLLDAETGDVLVPGEFDNVHGWQGLVVAWKGPCAALFNDKGLPMIPWESDLTELPGGYRGLTNGVGKIVCAGKAGLINKEGLIVLPCRYQDVGSLSEGLVPAKHEGLWGYASLADEWISPPRYEVAHAFLAGFAAVRKDGKVGLIDKAGNIRVPFRYADAGYVLDGRFPVAVEKDGKRLWGIADLDGNIVLPTEYDCVEWVDLMPGTTRYHGKPGWLEF